VVSWVVSGLRSSELVEELDLNFVLCTQNLKNPSVGSGLKCATNDQGEL
jgi:hypothetical protein